VDQSRRGRPACRPDRNVATYPDDAPDCSRQAAAEAAAIAAAFERCELRKPCEQSWPLADNGNQFMQKKRRGHQEDPARAKRVQEICTISLNCSGSSVVYLSPVMTKLGRNKRRAFERASATASDAPQPLVARRSLNFQPMITELKRKSVQAMIEESTKKPQRTRLPHRPLRPQPSMPSRTMAARTIATGMPRTKTCKS